jgi:hypothetical protein
VVLSFLGPDEPGAFLQPSAVVRARATVTPSDEAWDVLDGLTRTYLGSDVTFPAPRGPGFVVRCTIERVGGIGPWAS